VVPPKQETLELNGVPVEVEVHVLVSSEQGVKVHVCHRMRMRALGTEDHQIGHVHDPDPESWHELAKEGSGSDDLEGELDTNADEHHVRVHPVIGACELPDGGAGNTVLRRVKRVRHEHASHGRRDH
jgi:hypothetical protein